MMEQLDILSRSTKLYPRTWRLDYVWHRNSFCARELLSHLKCSIVLTWLCCALTWVYYHAALLWFAALHWGTRFNCLAHICTSTPFPLTVASGRFCLPITSLLVFVPEVVYRDLENGMVLIMTGDLKKKKIWYLVGMKPSWSLLCFLSLVQHHFLNDSCWLSAAKGKMLLKETLAITCVSVLWFHFSVNGSLFKNFRHEHSGFNLVPNMLGREQVCILLGVTGEGERSSVIPWGTEWKCRRRKTKGLLLSSGSLGFGCFGRWLDAIILSECN